MPAAKPARPAPTTLRQWRRFRRLTLEQVATKLNLDTSAVHKWEVGKTPVDIETLNLLAQVYDTEPAALLLPPQEAWHAERMRKAYNVIRALPPEVSEHWLSIGMSLLPPEGARPADETPVSTDKGREI